MRFHLPSLTVLVCVVPWLLTCSVFSESAHGAMHAASRMQTRVVDAWQRRQAVVRTGAFRYHQKMVVPRGSQNEMPQSQGRAGDWPPTDAVVEDPDIWLVFDGSGKFVHKTFLPALTEAGRAEARRSTTAFDGRESQSLIAESGAESATVAIYEAEQFEKLPFVELWPLLLAFRPFGADGLNLNLDSYRFGDAIVEVNGRRCIEMRSVTDNTSSGIASAYWLDVDRDFVAVRYEFPAPPEATTQPRIQLDIEYTEDATTGWMPSSWRFIMQSDTRGLLTDLTARMMEHTLNQPIADKEFTVEIPVGAVVVENGTTWIQREGGGRRMVTSAEEARGATYEQLVSTEPGLAGISPQRTGLFLGTSIALAALVAGIVLYTLRRKRRPSG